LNSCAITESIAATSERIAEELEKEVLVVGLGVQITQKEELIKGYNADLSKLVITGTPAQTLRHTALNEAVQHLASRVQAFGAQRRAFVAKSATHAAPNPPKCFAKQGRVMPPAALPLSNGMTSC
jgi:hypothetical protein